MRELTFLDAVASRLGCDRRRAEGITLVVFRELQQQLTPKEARDVAAQLSKGLKRLWDTMPPLRDASKVDRDEFIGRIRRRAALSDDAEALRGLKAVFAELQLVLGSPTGMEGEAWDVFSVLPKDLKQLWLAAGREPNPKQEEKAWN